MSNVPPNQPALDVNDLRAASIRQFVSFARRIEGYELSSNRDPKGGADDFILIPRRDERKPSYRLLLSADRCGQSVRLSDGLCLSDPIELFREINPNGAHGDGALLEDLASRLNPENSDQIKSLVIEYLPEVCARVLPGGWREIEQQGNYEGTHRWRLVSRDGRFAVRIAIKNSVFLGRWDDSVSGRSGDDFVSLVQMVRGFASADDALEVLADQFTISGGLRNNIFDDELLSRALGVLRSEIESWGAIDFLPFEALPDYKVRNRVRPVKGWRKPDPENNGYHLFYFTPTAFNGLWLEHKNKNADFAAALRFLGVLCCDNSDGTLGEPLPIGCPMSYCVIGRNLWSDLHKAAA